MAEEQQAENQDKKAKRKRIWWKEFFWVPLLVAFVTVFLFEPVRDRIFTRTARETTTSISAQEESSETDAPETTEEKTTPRSGGGHTVPSTESPNDEGQAQSEPSTSRKTTSTSITSKSAQTYYVPPSTTTTTKTQTTTQTTTKTPTTTTTARETTQQWLPVYTVKASCTKVLTFTDKNAEINAETSFPAKEVRLTCSGNGKNYGTWNMSTKNSYDWKFDASFYETGTYLLTITAYGDNGIVASDSLEIPYP